jgi:hypothetical protein
LCSIEFIHSILREADMIENHVTLGSLKTFAGQTRPWVTHLKVFEPRDHNSLIALLQQPGKLAVLIVKYPEFAIPSFRVTTC